MQLRHAVSAWSLKADDHDDVAIQFARLECGKHRVLIGEDPRRCLDRPPRRVNRARLKSRAPEVALNEAHAAIGIERLRRRSQYRLVARGARCTFPDQDVSIQLGLMGIFLKAL